MKRRFKRATPWLASPTFGLQSVTTSAALVGAGTSNVVTQFLLGTSNNPPTTEDVQNNYQADRFPTQVNRDIIVQTMFGRLGWAINGKVSGQTVASGVASIAVRASIFATPYYAPQGLGGETEMNYAGAALHTVMGDVSQAESFWLSSSRNQPPGFQLWWWRTWGATVDFGTQSQVNSESFSSPSTWVAAHPKKRLRSQQQLFACVQYSIINLNGLAGATQISLFPDLRLAARQVPHRQAR